MTRPLFAKNGNGWIIFLATIASCYVAFYNNFPLVYSDTGTYLDSGFKGIVPPDRPIFYGLFMRHVSLAETLWLVVLAQAWLTCWLLHRVLGIFIKGIQRNVALIGIIVLITLTTGYSYNVSILLPDIFATIGFLCLLVLLYSKELNKLQIVFVSVIFVFSISMHNSNLPIYFLLFAGLGIHLLWRRRKKKEVQMNPFRLVLASGLFGLTLLLIPAVNYSYDGEFRYSKGSHVFLFNHMIEIGAVKLYLEDNCDKNDYAICQYKDELNWNFMWDYYGPLYKTGGWEKNKEDFDAINRGIMTTPKYWPLLIQKTATYTTKQFFRFETKLQTVEINGPPHLQMERYLPNSTREYLASKQLKKEYDLFMLNRVEGVIVFLSIIICLLALILDRRFKLLHRGLKALISISLVYGAINAMVCANLSTVDDRYQNRWVWLLVVFTVLVFIDLYSKRSEIVEQWKKFHSGGIA
ncbi:MAG: hypothetical protein NXI10_01565 [bacterium]|nr:hypothetical protein [bacterium]